MEGQKLKGNLRRAPDCAPLPGMRLSQLPQLANEEGNRLYLRSAEELVCLLLGPAS